MNPRTETPPEVRRRRLLISLASIAALLVLGEAVWFSGPVQDRQVERLSVEQLRRRTTTEPGNTRVRFHLSERLRELGRYEDARTQAEDAIRMDASEPRTHRAAGLAALELGDLDSAARHLTEARNRGDRSEASVVGQTQVELAQQRMGAALRTAEAGVQRHPKSAELWYLLGRARGALGIPTGWREAMTQATELNPRDGRYWVGLAEACLFLDDGRKASDAARIAIALNTADTRAWLAEARAQSMVARTPEEIETALQAFGRAHTGAGLDSVEGLAEHGKYLLVLNRPVPAIPLLEQALAILPDDPSYAYALAGAYRRAGRIEQGQRLMARFEAASGVRREMRYLRARLTVNPADSTAARRLEALAKSSAKPGETRHSTKKD